MATDILTTRLKRGKPKIRKKKKADLRGDKAQLNFIENVYRFWLPN